MVGSVTNRNVFAEQHILPLHTWIRKPLLVRRYRANPKLHDVLDDDAPIEAIEAKCLPATLRLSLLLCPNFVFPPTLCLCCIGVRWSSCGSPRDTARLVPRDAACKCIAPGTPRAVTRDTKRGSLPVHSRPPCRVRLRSMIKLYYSFAMNQTYLGGVRGRELRQSYLPREVAEIPAGTWSCKC